MDEVPEVMRGQLHSLRAYDDAGWMLDADIVEGRDVEALAASLFDNSKVD